MLSDGAFPKVKGAFYLNRDPILFAKVAQYLREQCVDKGDLDITQKRALTIEFHFFGISTIEWDLSSLEGHGQVVEDLFRTGQWHSIISVHPTTKFSVQVISVKPAKHIMIGFVPKAKYNQGKQNHMDGSFVFYNGQICSPLGRRYYSDVGINNNSIVTAVHDTLNGDISFEVDGVNLGVAFPSIKSVMHAIIEMAEDDTIKLL